MKILEMESRKCVIVGDGGVGKTCMLVSYKYNNFPHEYVPTVFENYTVNVTSGRDTCQLRLFDTAGQEDFDRLRPLSYPSTDVVLICFSVIMPSSLENILEKWIPEVRHYCPTAPFLLVGTQIDLREDKESLQQLAKINQKPSSSEEGEKLAQEVGATQYLECSALTKKGLKSVFEAVVATKLEMNCSKKKKKICCTKCEII